MESSAAQKIPEVGQAVRVRNRLATVRAVEPYDSRTASGRLHITPARKMLTLSFQG
jgi:hypothetical protein